MRCAIALLVLCAVTAQGTAQQGGIRTGEYDPARDNKGGVITGELKGTEKGGVVPAPFYGEPAPVIYASWTPGGLPARYIWTGDRWAPMCGQPFAPPGFFSPQPSQPPGRFRLRFLR